MKVRAIWEFDVDTEDFDPKYVDIPGLAKELTERELEYNLQNGLVKASDFEYEVVEELTSDA